MWSVELGRGHVALALVADYAVNCDAVSSFRTCQPDIYAESLEKHCQVGRSRINSTIWQRMGLGKR